MAQQQPIRSGTKTGDREIPDKLYFRIGDVAKLCEVPAYVLRFWESEFPQLKPNKGGTGQRLYRRRDVEMAMRIKTLLYDEGYTIAGAKQVFKVEQRHKEPVLALGIDTGPAKEDLQKLRRLRKEMQDLLTVLSKPVGGKQPGAPVQSIRSARSRQVAKPELEVVPESLFDASPAEPGIFPDTTE